MAKKRKSGESKLISDYNREYDNLKRRIRRVKSKGFEVPDSLLPVKPTRITEGSIRKLKKLTGDYIQKHSIAPVVAKPVKKKSPDKPKVPKLEREYNALRKRVTDYLTRKEKAGIKVDFTLPTTAEKVTPTSLKSLQEDYEKLKRRVTRSKFRPQAGVIRIDVATGEVIQEAAKPKGTPGLQYGRGAKRESFKERAIRELEEKENPGRYETVEESGNFRIVLDKETGTKRVSRKKAPIAEAAAVEPTRAIELPTTLAGYDDEAEYIINNIPEAGKQVEALQDLLKERTGAVIRRYPVESAKDYAERLLTALRIAGYRKELGEYDERGDRETQNEYMERLGSEAARKTGKQTISEKVKQMQEQIQKAYIEKTGFDPFKPVDDSDRVTIEELVNFIEEHKEEFGPNLPRWADYRRRETLIEHLRREDERTIRNRMLTLQKDLKELRELRARNAERDRTLRDEDIPRFDDIEDISDAVDGLVQKYGYLPVGDVLEQLRDTWRNTLATHTEREVREYLKDTAGEILTLIDDAISARAMYHFLQGDLKADAFGVEDYHSLMRHLNLGQAMTFREALAYG